MHRRPSKTELLDALSQFLMTEVSPAVTDKKVGFRVLIAAHLASTVAAELGSQSARTDAELARLQALLPGVVEGDARMLPEAEREDALERLNTHLTGRIREGTLKPEELAQAGQHLKATLLEALAIVNPRFDTSDTLEGEQDEEGAAR